MIARDHENPYRASAALATLARVALASGDIAKAGLLWGSAESVLTSGRNRFGLGEYGGDLLTQVDPTFASARQRGGELELWDVVAIALSELELPQTEP